MPVVTPALPVDVYSIHSNEKKRKPSDSVEYVVYIYMQCTWHHKITKIFHTFWMKLYIW